ncbi:shikimate dehydrogenase [Microbacterium terrae]|uniref:shikimate dehydrogenase family protein n=1 Tax=Microbacterium terrae TaxID=69369 RepID=UPI001B6B5AF5|nr:shikimate dehydrogenase [Microbacterium terrae]MBP1077374.1 shikimate dehydrogenase [Microbacterium terrae]
MRRQPGLGVLNGARRLAVWGDPIDHSRSPQLHAAAYDVLDVDWIYGRRRVDESTFADELAGLDGTWRGLSLTMPLKGVAHRAAVSLDERAARTGAVNTLLLTPDGPLGFNTDVGGIVRALGEHGIASADSARIVGAGATATSALVALAELGATEVDVVARRAEAVAPLRALGDDLGVAVRHTSFTAALFAPVDVTIATLPGDAAIAPEAAAALAADGGFLLDVVYGHWPTPLSRAWDAAGGASASGLGMLLHQAILQIRIFRSGDVDHALPREDAVLSAMRSVLERPAA